MITEEEIIEAMKALDKYPFSFNTFQYYQKRQLSQRYYLVTTNFEIELIPSIIDKETRKNTPTDD